MAMLIWNAGGAPPSGPGIAMSVLAATWFQWLTSLASVPVGGAAETLTAPRAARSAPTATAMKAMGRLDDIVLLSVVPGWMGRVIASSSVPSSTGGTDVTCPYPI